MRSACVCMYSLGAWSLPVDVYGCRKRVACMGLIVAGVNCESRVWRIADCLSFARSQFPKHPLPSCMPLRIEEGQTSYFASARDLACNS